jgi:hypothetical protein
MRPTTSDRWSCGMSVSTSFGVEQQPVEISEAELSTLPKTQIRPFAHFTHRVGIQTASALESVSLQDFPNQWIPILPRQLWMNTSFADAMNRRNCPHSGTLASAENMSSLSPKTQARPITPCVVSNLLYPVFKYQTPRIRLERGEELGSLL